MERCRRSGANAVRRALRYGAAGACVARRSDAAHPLAGARSARGRIASETRRAIEEQPTRLVLPETVRVHAQRAVRLTVARVKDARRPSHTADRRRIGRITVHARSVQHGLDARRDWDGRAAEPHVAGVSESARASTGSHHTRTAHANVTWNALSGTSTRCGGGRRSRGISASRSVSTDIARVISRALLGRQRRRIARIWARPSRTRAACTLPRVAALSPVAAARAPARALDRRGRRGAGAAG
jgi:hypothetical protein